MSNQPNQVSPEHSAGLQAADPELEALRSQVDSLTAACGRALALATEIKSAWTADIVKQGESILALGAAIAPLRERATVATVRGFDSDSKRVVVEISPEGWDALTVMRGITLGAKGLLILPLSCANAPDST